MGTPCRLLLIGASLALLLSACRSAPAPHPPPSTPPEQSIRPIPLSGPLSSPDAEISGMAWYGDRLILLPQYPRLHMSETRGRVFALSRSQIEAFLGDSLAPPLVPREITVLAEGLSSQTSTYQGCEAIAFRDHQAYIIVEATKDSMMHGYVVSGTVDPDADTIRVDARTATPIPQESQLVNMSYESLLAIGDTLVTLYEANGANVNPKPQAPRFTSALHPMEALSFPTIEYRITDVTEVDSAGRFWAINYFYPGEREKLNPAPDSLALNHGTGATHQRSAVVERLVEFQYTPQGIQRTERPPLLLKLANNDARNWEGIVRLGDRGFLIVTDQFPETILAFVPFPNDPAYSGRAKSTTTGK